LARIVTWHRWIVIYSIFKIFGSKESQESIIGLGIVCGASQGEPVAPFFTSSVSLAENQYYGLLIIQQI
jgi:hypothetical protein